MGSFLPPHLRLPKRKAIFTLHPKREMYLKNVSSLPTFHSQEETAYRVDRFVSMDRASEGQQLPVVLS